jgi:hypothetical protein
LLFALLYVPPLQRAFHTRPLDGRTWAVLVLWPVVVLGAEEARKVVLRRRTPKEAMA